MMRIIEALLAEQTARLQKKTLTSEREKELQWLSANVPATVLQKFERFVLRGKRGVATVRNGVCGECHLRLASGALAGLAYTTELHYCDNCGRLLYLPADEPLTPTSATAAAVSAAKAPAKKARARASATV